MVKQITTLVMALLLSAAVSAQTWVGFGGQAAGTPPEINVLQSDNQQVKFTVSLSGMYVETKNTV